MNKKTYNQKSLSWILGLDTDSFQVHQVEFDEAQNESGIHWLDNGTGSITQIAHLIKINVQPGLTKIFLHKLPANVIPLKGVA